MKTYIQNKQVEQDLEKFASEDGIQRGIMCDSSGNIRTERVSATSQTTWFFKTKAGKPYVWNGSIDPMAEFKTKLTVAIVAKIAQLRSEGTVGMSPNNLFMLVSVPKAIDAIRTSEQYRKVFNECLFDLPTAEKRFLI